MSKKNKNNNGIVQLPFEKIEIIKKFAKDMGYTIDTYYYTHCFNGKKCFGIELIGTSDAEGNPYSWAWYVETGQEVYRRA